MEARVDIKRVKNRVHEDRTHVVHRQRFIFTYATTQVTRGIWSFGNQIVVSTLFQYKYESELCRAHSRRMYCGVDEMGISEIEEIMMWYEGQKNRVFDIKLVLE